MSERLIRLFSSYFGNITPNSVGECGVNCPFHDDELASMSVNVNTGLWYCFRCDIGGDQYDLYKRMKKLDGVELRFSQVKAEVDGLYGEPDETEEQTVVEETIKNIDENKVMQWRMLLDRTPRIKSFLLNKRGLTEDTLSKYKIGWDIERVTIPIYDNHGNCINIRRYSAASRSGHKMLSYRAGYGDAVLYPIENMKNDTIILTEGEMDCLLANQLGYNAVTVTGGANTWREDWNQLFQNKICYICYDVDRAGQTGARKIATKIYPVASLVKIIHLPINDPPDGDFTNYIVDLGHTKDDFDRLIEETRAFTLGDQTLNSNEEHFVHLSQASNSEYDGKKVRFNVVVAGKDTSPFIIPKKMEISCQMDGRVCATCGLSVYNGRRELNISNFSKIPQLVDCSNAIQNNVIRSMVGIPKLCASFKTDKMESQNVDQLLLIPEIDFGIGNEEQKYVLRKAYHVYNDGTGLVPNRSYDMHGVTVPDPKSQYSIHIINDVELSRDNISEFELNADKFRRLRIFQCGNKTVKEKFEEIHKDFVYNVTHIYGRNDLLTALDLTYHSALIFEFMGKAVPKGQVECLILGDTRTGKSETVLCMMNHYKLGELITCENTSFAGVIGGMEQNGKRLILRWGKLPLNDRRMVILDEVSGMSHDTIGLLSGVRSSGVAEITKIGVQQKTSCRVRLFWMSNPRSGRSLSEYDFGTDAIVELMGRSEDIARFDFAMTCASNEVDSLLINTIHQHGTVPHTYTFDLCKDLLLWAWSRKKDNIYFEHEAIEMILRYANEMGNNYSSKIPLVEAANQRIKLAKMAVAAAIRVFSTEDGENVIVKKEHVQFVRDYLEEMYRKPSLGYYQMSKTSKRQEELANQSKSDVMAFLNVNRGACDFFLNNTSFNGKVIEELLDVDRMTAKRYLKFLNKSGMIVQTPSGYRKSAHFITFLREWMSNNEGGENDAQDDNDNIQT